MTTLSSHGSLRLGPRRKPAGHWVVGFLALVVGVLAVGCNTKPPPKEDKTIEVDVTTPITDEVLDFDDFTGRLEAKETVEIRPVVSGYILEAPFKEGEKVREKDVLFLINPELYKADFEVADANVTLAVAERNLQEANAARARTLLGSRSMSREEYDQVIGAREKAKASVLAMTAARLKTKILVAYTKVEAPISGRISRRAADPGNLVKAGETLLTTIVADDKVYAYFDVDERTYLKLTGEKVSGSSDLHANDLKLPVLMRLANEDEFEQKGVVDFVDNRLNGNTGTIRMRGVFPNPRGVLKAGLFVRIRLPLGRPYPALLIPDEAIQSDQGKKYVYVIDDDEKAQYRPIIQGQAVQGLRVIKEGLKPGERVVINGMQRVQRDKPVKATPKPQPKSPGFPLGKLLYPSVTAGDKGTRGQGDGR